MRQKEPGKWDCRKARVALAKKITTVRVLVVQFLLLPIPAIVRGEMHPLTSCSYSLQRTDKNSETTWPLKPFFLSGIHFFVLFCIVFTMKVVNKDMQVRPLGWALYAAWVGIAVNEHVCSVNPPCINKGQNKFTM